MMCVLTYLHACTSTCMYVCMLDLAGVTMLYYYVSYKIRLQYCVCSDAPTVMRALYHFTAVVLKELLLTVTSYRHNLMIFVDVEARFYYQ